MEATSCGVDNTPFSLHTMVAEMVTRGDGLGVPTPVIKTVAWCTCCGSILPLEQFQLVSSFALYSLLHITIHDDKGKYQIEPTTTYIHASHAQL